VLIICLLHIILPIFIYSSHLCWFVYQLFCSTYFNISIQLYCINVFILLYPFVLLCFLNDIFCLFSFSNVYFIFTYVILTNSISHGL
jgi:hypothetical protein